MEKKLRSIKMISDCSDVIGEFEKRLKYLRDMSDVENFVSDINQQIKSDLSAAQMSALKSIRQKAYDKKRILTLAKDINSNQIPWCEYEDEKKAINENFSSERIFQTSDRSIRRENKYLEALKEHKNFLQTIFKILTYVSLAALSLLFVYVQSVPIYKSIGFSSPEFCALGSLLLILGFAVLYAMTNSKILLLLCLYASSYEVLLIVKGTFKNDSAIAHEIVSTNKSVQWVEEKASHAKEIYTQAKEKYEDPNSKLFQNLWFKKKFLDPAWDAYEADQSKIEAIKKSLTTESTNADTVSILKIMFRLGLVFLSMISVHLAINTVRKNVRFSNV